MSRSLRGAVKEIFAPVEIFITILTQLIRTSRLTIFSKPALYPMLRQSKHCDLKLVFLKLKSLSKGNPFVDVNTIEENATCIYTIENGVKVKSEFWNVTRQWLFSYSFFTWPKQIKIRPCCTEDDQVQSSTFRFKTVGATVWILALSQRRMTSRIGCFRLWHRYVSFVLSNRTQ